METTSPVAPALNALSALRKEIKDRVGKEGGNLNKRLLAQLDVVESTLLQIEPLGNMLKIVNQQSEVAVHGFRALSKIQLRQLESNGGDDGTSETKGE